jgi:hypothetical protein
LSAENAEHLSNIAAMLFLKDDLRLKSASYALVPYVDLEHPLFDCENLKRLRDVIAFCYATPHQTFGDPFLSFEHVSIVLFSTGKVSKFRVRPAFHTVPTAGGLVQETDEVHQVEGYRGLYNFQYHFAAVKGSRVYPIVPDVTLNHSQELDADCEQFSRSLRFGGLFGLIQGTQSPAAERILRAIGWFNKANGMSADHEHRLLHLAVAFETLLELPENERITERLIDSVSLLLGRVPRLDSWVRQFYEVRSEIVHKGKATSIRFALGDTKKDKKEKEGSLYRPILSYGYLIFQLCVTTLLVGAEMAEKAHLKQQFIGNVERFNELCTLLSDKSLTASQKLSRIDPIIAVIRKNQFFWESNLSGKTTMGVVRLTAKVLLEHDGGLDLEVRKVVQGIADAKRSSDEYESLAALNEFHQQVPNVIPSGNPERTAALDLLDLVWRMVFPEYFRLRDTRGNGAAGKAQVGTPLNETP